MEVPTEDDLTKKYPFLRSCEKESTEPVTGEITGNIPKWLEGSLLRNGPGLLHVGQDHYKHVFDGLSLLRAFRIKDGSVTYQNRFLRSDTYERNMKAQRIVVSEFGTKAYPDPCKTIFERFSSIFSFHLSDNNNINIIELSDGFYTATETPTLRKIDPNTLETTGKLDLSKLIAVNTATAHPHTEPDGTVYNMGSQFTKCKPTYNIIKFSPSKNQSFEASVVASIPVQYRLYPSYYHSFGMSENYFIFVEQPFTISIPKMMKIMTFGGAIAESLKWRPEREAQFYLVRKDTGQIHPVQYKAKAFLFFHQINAYEEDGYVIFDLCAYKDASLVYDFYIKEVEKLGKDFKKFSEAIASEARRYVFPLNIPEKCGERDNLVRLERSVATAFKRGNDVVVNYESLTENVAELPRINYEKYNGKKYRYFYGVSRNDVQTQLIKVDTETRTSLTWLEKSIVVGEPVFVNKPDSSDEDDGVILSSVLSEEDESMISLLVLDAKTFTELGRATFHMQTSVPDDLHGMFTTKVQ